MNTLKFVENYLQDQAIVTIAEDGKILYEGAVGGAKYYLLKYSTLDSIEGLDSMKDIILNIIRCKDKKYEVEECEF